MGSDQHRHRASSSVTSWTVERLTSAVERDQGDFRIVLPRFQRSVVWNDDQKRALINSVARGFPVGALLAYQRADSAQSFELIDGLQRTSTLCAYQKQPLAWAPKELLNGLPQLLAPLEGDLERMAPEARDAAVDRLHDAVAQWMTTTGTTKMGDGFTPGKLLSALIDRFAHDDPIFPSLASLDPDSAFAEFLDALQLALDISGVEIPFIQFQGDARDLPEVFERLNQEGTKLSKYQVFAATWINTTTEVANEAVRDAINRRYEDLWDAGFEVDGLENGVVPDEYSLFEYLFGFGKVIGATFPELFAARDSAVEEPAPFMLFALLEGHSPSDLDKLPELLPRVADNGPIDPGPGEAAIVESLDFVRDAIAPFMSLKLNADKKSKTRKWPHGDYQAMSYAARVAASRAIGEPGSSEFEDDRAQLALSIPAHYLLDVLAKTWRGPLYTLVFESVWAREEGGPLRPAARYTTPPSRTSAEAVLDEWFAVDQLSRKQRSRPNIRPAEKVFLKFLYATVVTHHQNHAEAFELEHLFPVSRLATLVGNDKQGWPISCIANLALFPKKLNREKSKKTIREYLATIKDRAEAKKTELLIEPFLLCSIDSVNVPSEHGVDSLTRDAYESFLRHRWVTMRDRVLENLGYD